jgi:YidC/Oxa1 family membrane protein insertase
LSITSVMESILRYFTHLTGNLGWAIIIITVLIKAILHPLQVNQIKMMEGMKALTPKIKELEQKYKGQPQEYQQRLAELYRDNKVNPMAGCLPALIPLPVLVVFFRVLQNKAFVDSFGAAKTSFLWLPSLSAPDPWILPILSAATMWFSMTQSTTDQSQKTMTIVMPLFFGWFTRTMPSGAAVYWVATNVVSILQHYLIQRQLAAPKKGVS